MRCTIRTTITKCQSKEVAKKHRAEIMTEDIDTVAAINSQASRWSESGQIMPRVWGERHTGEATANVLPSIKPVHIVIKCNFLQGFAGVGNLSIRRMYPMPLSWAMPSQSNLNQVVTNKVAGDRADPAPTYH